MADLPTIAALAGTVWRAHYPGIIPPAQIEYMLARMYDLDELGRQLRGGVRFDLAAFDGAVAGFAAYGLLPRDPGGARADDELRLHKLYILPACQRRGVGSALIRHVAAHARTRGCPRLSLTVNRANHAAIAAYRRNGFTVRESVVVDIGGGFVMDDHVMELAFR